MIVVVASVRDDLANYVNVIAYVYAVTIIIYVLVNLAFSAGLRIPYSRPSSAFLGFLRDVCEPILRLFRRILPSFGGLDLSPVVAIVVLRLAGSLISSAIRG